VTFKPGVFTSRTTCTPADLELERALNAKLKLGKVTCYTVDMTPPRYGVCFTWRGMSRTHERPEFFGVAYADELVDALMTMADGMQNARLSPAWTANEDELKDMPQWLEDIIDAAL